MKVSEMNVQVYCGTFRAAFQKVTLSYEGRHS